MYGIDWKDVAIRAGKTAVQTFIAMAAVGDLMALNSGRIEAAALAALSAAVSVLWNTLSAWANS